MAKKRKQAFTGSRQTRLVGHKSLSKTKAKAVRNKPPHYKARRVSREPMRPSERKFIQRFFVDKFKSRDGSVEYEVWTISTQHVPALKSKEALARKLKEVV